MTSLESYLQDIEFRSNSANFTAHDSKTGDLLFVDIPRLIEMVKVMKDGLWYSCFCFSDADDDHSICYACRAADRVEQIAKGES